MWSKISGLNLRRQRLLSKTPAGALHDLYSEPFPNLKSSLSETAFVVLDFETTGLNIASDHIISAGLVEIHNLGISLETAWYDIIKTDRALTQQSTIIHQITDDMLLNGINIREVLEKILRSLTGKVLVAHHAKLEFGFLNRLCQLFYKVDFLVPTIDTQRLARRQLLRNQVVLQESTLRLFNLRGRYKLPSYKAHNALSDALSTAELFLAVVADLYPERNCRIKDLLI